jgi:hypothetical protein
MGIEPTSSAWKAEVIAIIRHPPSLHSPFDISTLQLTYICSLSWWRGEDSNLRRLSRQIYSLIPLATREPLPKSKRRSLMEI